MQKTPILFIVHTLSQYLNSLMKSILFILVVLQLIFCSSAGWVFRSAKPVETLSKGAPESNLAGRTIKNAPELAHEPTINTQYSPQGKAPSYKRETTFDHPLSNFNPSVSEASANVMAKAFGARLAAKLFGPGGEKGFRWGYKQGKRIHSAAGKCNRFMEKLTADSLCPKPLETSPDMDTVKCIVEVTNLGRGTCLPPYESDQYPPEANCTLEVGDKIDPQYCNP